MTAQPNFADLLRDASEAQARTNSTRRSCSSSSGPSSCAIRFCKFVRSVGELSNVLEEITR
jgi:hypothetical protein